MAPLASSAMFTPVRRIRTDQPNATLHQLFDGVDQKTTDRILLDSFAELFPDAPLPPTSGTLLGDEAIR